ncbi:HNH endonuclease [Saccharophagus degradans]|uniref:HNH endonuclease n=1 Tax=Saccharophagus degradans (strain 2-40 / ATCC 43961 / DSM 17024) TaxID=203122 RepID=Q21FQ7_SACD2|nr:HNH endonuclease [Saccharophagus degradans]ABD82472.1 HNH endonuclease [Saccharophagus degradans 2-40]WGO99332.1 HNH endonuclease [Saccharophagus degradans]
MEARILRLNIAGQPIEWLHWQQAVTVEARGLVAWRLGEVVRTVRGGRCRLSGKRTRMALSSIIACDGERMTPVKANPPLTNSALFLRDKNQCLYCGQIFTFADLSRDHVHPSSRGGEDKWENVVAACKRCNQKKGDSLLSEIDMPLIALPYRPNPYEYLALTNSARILGDQMAYLQPQFHHYSCARPTFSLVA